MAVPTYDDLLTRWKVEKSLMKQTFNDDDLIRFGSKLDSWEILARHLKIPNSEIANIKSQGDLELQKIKMLECWKRRCGSVASYEIMTKALLDINRTDLAETVIQLRLPSGNVNNTQSTSTTNPIISPLSSKLEVAMSPLSITDQNALTVQEDGLKQSLRNLEDGFFELVTFVEVTLKSYEIPLETITRRFRMLPQSIRRRHETDENYTSTRHKIFNSATVKELFDNLTELKHWNYMIPDTLAHILQDVKIDDIHQKLEKYKTELASFKASTKLRDLIGLSIAVPDYCIELTMEVEGWEDKTIEDVEKAAVNILRPAGYNGHFGWKKVLSGSLKLVLILTQSISLDTLDIHSKEKLCLITKDYGVLSIQIDGADIHSTQLEVKLYTTSVAQNNL